MPILFAFFHVTFLVSMAIHGKHVEKEVQGSNGFPDAVLVDEIKDEAYKPSHLDKRVR